MACSADRHYYFNSFFFPSAGGSTVFFSVHFSTSCCGLNGDGELRTCSTASLCAHSSCVCVGSKHCPMYRGAKFLTKITQQMFS